MLNNIERQNMILQMAGKDVHLHATRKGVYTLSLSGAFWVV
jgi:hypothetical protein